MRRLILTILLAMRYADIPNCWRLAGIGLAWKQRACKRAAAR